MLPPMDSTRLEPLGPLGIIRPAVPCPIGEGNSGSEVQPQTEGFRNALLRPDTSSTFPSGISHCVG
jgi:hypothetical protein